MKTPDDVHESIAWLRAGGFAEVLIDWLALYADGLPHEIVVKCFEESWRELRRDDD